MIINSVLFVVIAVYGSKLLYDFCLKVGDILTIGWPRNQRVIGMCTAFLFAAVCSLAWNTKWSEWLL